MSRVKNLSRGGWMIVGVVVALILVPTAAVAATATVVKIEASNGNKLAATAGGQLLTAEANPNSFFQSPDAYPTDSYTEMATPPSGMALVVTEIHIDTVFDSTPGNGDYVGFIVESGTTCDSFQVGTWYHFVNPPTIGETDLSMDPGIGIPDGDSLCAGDGGNVSTQISVSGYAVPSSEVTGGPLKAPTKLRQ